MRNNRMSIKEKSIVFIGFMGVGKTTIGALVAKKLYRTFIDIDQEIEAMFNMSISEIFEKHGEAKFRELEKDTIKSYCNQKLKIISVGGGAFMQPEVRDICLTNCIVFYLDMSWEQWKERLNILIDSRPVLQGRDINEIEELFYKRQGAYSLNHSTLNVDEQTANDAADYIVESLKLAWDLYE
ncbi:shikimate kinase [Bacillus sp. FJAT-29790]|uniref:shikimate kinase n=1 Tax=Bacillus sp. FJAT-29790 TaxID=1895002 RepID=UPI001C215487|nr:shikimate kinase [Bacillus sp. FJAT-29790]MBU8878702.1 shikimate kinase [Bacillus sp. FJAT-29790]